MGISIIQKKLFMSVAVEVSELVENFQWLNEGQDTKDSK